MASHADDEPRTTLDLLEQEDLVIRDLLSQIASIPGNDVDARWDRGSVEKVLLDHVAVREAAKHYLADGLSDLGRPELAERVLGDARARIPAIDRLDYLMAGVQPVSLGPDVREAVADLAGILGPDLEGDLADIVPALRAELTEDQLQSAFRDPRYVRKHAPTHPAEGGHWWQGWGPLERLHTLWDHLRAEPSGATRPGSDLSVGERLGQLSRHVAGGVPSGLAGPTHHPDLSQVEPEEADEDRAGEHGPGGASRPDAGH